MAIIVVGGQARKVGKTSVVAGLIAALVERQWMAVKITQHAHETGLAGLELCERAGDGRSWSIVEERDRSGGSDTSRFLLAGARRALWVRTPQGSLADAMPALGKQMEGADNAIIESNNVMEYLRPDLYLLVLDCGTADVKPTARLYLDRASAVILHDCPPGAQPAWNVALLKLIQGKPIFRVHPPQYLSCEIVEFVRAALREKLRIQNEE